MSLQRASNRRTWTPCRKPAQSTAPLRQRLEGILKLPGLPHAFLHGLCQENKVSRRLVGEIATATPGHTMDERKDAGLQWFTNHPSAQMRLG